MIHKQHYQINGKAICGKKDAHITSFQYEVTCKNCLKILNYNRNK